MSQDSQYSDNIIKFMREAGRPVTVSEIQEAVGMSRQAAYQWKDRNLNANRLKQVGKGRASADSYVLVDGALEAGNLSTTWQTTENPVVRAATGEGVDLAELKLDQAFRVKGMRKTDDGRTIVTFAADDGSCFEVVGE